MKSRNKIANFQLLQNAMKTPYTFYVLGAGASAPEIPPTGQIVQNLIRSTEYYGVVPKGSLRQRPLQQRLLGDYIKKENNPLLRLRLGHISESFLKVNFLIQMAAYTGRDAPPQYRILRLVKAPSTFFTMNIDGLARRYLWPHGHIILEPHGISSANRIPEFWRADWAWHAYHSDEDLFNCPEIGLPAEEGKAITVTPPYNLAKKARLLARAKFIVFIGYSFGMFNGKMDDVETFSFLTELIKQSPKTILVLDANPEPICAAISCATGSNRAFGIQVYWNLFAQSLLEATRGKISNKSRPPGDNVEQLFYLYDRAYEHR